MKRSGLTATSMILGAMALVLASVASAGFQTREEALAALQQYNRLIEAAPNRADLYTLRGDAYYALNDLYGAMENYTAAIKLDDRQDNAFFGRGMALGRMGLVDDGIADLDVYIQRHPHSSVAYTKRGVRNIWRNNLVEAERDLARAVELDPSNAEAHDDLGVVHAKHNRISLAAKHFSTAIHLDPGYQKAYHNLAICFYLRGQHREALEIVDAGLQLDPDSRDSLLLKLTVLQALGRTDEAKGIAERAEFLPESNWSERSEAGALSKQGEKK
ncbi:MAG TPA: tetratricopeptide repeat protein [Thiobacillus sp.]|nr:tetratricopeptide repeat protein [Thiobacillus sp.]